MELSCGITYGSLWPSALGWQKDDEEALLSFPVPALSGFHNSGPMPCISGLLQPTACGSATAFF